VLIHRCCGTYNSICMGLQFGMVLVHTGEVTSFKLLSCSFGLKHLRNKLLDVSVLGHLLGHIVTVSLMHFAAASNFVLVSDNLRIESSLQNTTIFVEHTEVSSIFVLRIRWISLIYNR